MKVMVYIVSLLALAAPGAALLEVGYANSQFTATDQPIASADMAGFENTEPGAATSSTVIDDWGLPLFTPGHAG